MFGYHTRIDYSNVELSSESRISRLAVFSEGGRVGGWEGVQQGWNTEPTTDGTRSLYHDTYITGLLKIG